MKTIATTFSTGYSTQKDPAKAGAEAARISLKKAGKNKPNIVIVFCSSAYDTKKVVSAIRNATNKVPLVGCTTSGEFSEDHDGKESVICTLISSTTHKFKTGIGTGLKKNPGLCIKKATKGFPRSVKGFPHLSCILLLDGLAGVGDSIPLLALNQLGPNVKLVGGAAGDDLGFKRTEVFHNDTVRNDAIVMAYIASKKPISLGIEHGHEPISYSLEVTKSKGNKLIEVNNKKAYDIWLEQVRNIAKKDGLNLTKLVRKDPEEIQKMFLRYEFGVFTGEGYKVRWPIGINKDLSVNFACSIPKGSVIKIMKGTKKSQIKSAALAAKKSKEDMGSKPAGALVFDCAVRGVILGKEFGKALNGIKKSIKGIPLAGFETYGEIGMELGNLSGFHNTTTAIMLLPD